MKRMLNVRIHKVLPAVTLIVIFLMAGCGAPSTQSTPSNEGTEDSSSAASAQAVPTPRIPAFFARVEDAKPLPEVLDPKRFSSPAVVRGYQYAKENPELFAQQPCYCYCDAGYKHRSLLDCYASDHSVGCQLCLKEGYLVNKLHKEGKSAAEIRDQIIRGEWQNMILD